MLETKSFIGFQVERLRQRAERDHVADKEWWNENLPAILHLARIKSAATAVCAAQPCSGSQRRPNCPRGTDPGSFTRLTQASTEVPGVLWVSLFPHRKHAATSSIPRQVAREVHPSALTTTCARCARHWATVCRVVLPVRARSLKGTRSLACGSW